MRKAFVNFSGVAIATAISLLPVGSAAQTPVSTQPAPSTTPAGEGVRTGALRHLTEADRVVRSISDAPLKSDGKKRLASLRKHFAELTASYNMNPDPVAPAIPDATGDAKAGKAVGSANWKAAFTDVENDLAGILGGGGTMPTPAPSGAGAPVYTVGSVPSNNAAIGTTGQSVQDSPVAAGNPPAVPPGTAAPPANTPSQPVASTTAAPTNTPSQPVTSTTAPGAAQAQPVFGANAGMLAGAIGIPNLDPEVRRQLEEFRLNVELFFAATLMNFEAETATR
jgi:hypothetical protein